MKKVSVSKVIVVRIKDVKPTFKEYLLKDASLAENTLFIIGLLSLIYFQPIPINWHFPRKKSVKSSQK
jgi:hypothetical protein